MKKILGAVALAVGLISAPFVARKIWPTTEVDAYVGPRAIAARISINGIDVGTTPYVGHLQVGDSIVLIPPDDEHVYVISLDTKVEEADIGTVMVGQFNPRQQNPETPYDVPLNHGETQQ